MMNRTVTCTCGYCARARDDEELYSLVRGHMDPRHPEQHRVVARYNEERAPLTSLFTTGTLRAMSAVGTGR
ncbi:MAG: hypothetical protein NVS4B2_14420 [Chloroflexota bacterium]